MRAWQFAQFRADEAASWRAGLIIRRSWVPARRAQRHAAAITAAAESGTGRLVITTWQDLDHCPLPEVSDYPATEARARAARIPLTILRLTSDLAALVARDVRWAVAAGTLTAPAGQARITPAAIADLAEATANVLRGGWASSPTSDLAHLLHRAPASTIEAVRQAATA